MFTQHSFDHLWYTIPCDTLSALWIKAFHQLGTWSSICIDKWKTVLAPQSTREWQPNVHKSKRTRHTKHFFSHPALRQKTHMHTNNGVGRALPLLGKALAGEQWPNIVRVGPEWTGWDVLVYLVYFTANRAASECFRCYAVPFWELAPLNQVWVKGHFAESQAFLSFCQTNKQTNKLKTYQWL